LCLDASEKSIIDDEIWIKFISRLVDICETNGINFSDSKFSLTHSSDKTSISLLYQPLLESIFTKDNIFQLQKIRRSNKVKSNTSILFLGIEFRGKGKYLEICFPVDLPNRYRTLFSLPIVASFMSPADKMPRKMSKELYSPQYVLSQYKKSGLDSIEAELRQVWTNSGINSIESFVLMLYEKTRCIF